MAVEEGELLLPVRRIVGGIEIDGDASGAPLPPGSVLRDDEIGQRVSQAGERQWADGILEPRERGLRRQRGTRERVAVQQQLVHGIVGQAGGVVAVGVATDQPEDALPHQLEHVVLDLARLPSVPQAVGDGLGDPQLPIECLEQHGPAVGAGVLGVELGHHKLVELEAELRYTVCSHRASWSACAESSRQRSFRTLQRLDGSFLSSFTHKAGCAPSRAFLLRVKVPPHPRRGDA
jgi:hypothetical protein